LTREAAIPAPARVSSLGPAALLEGLPDAAWMVELLSMRVTAINAQACSLLGRPRDELVGQPAQALAASPEDLAWWDAAAQGELNHLHSDTLVVTSGGMHIHVTRSIRAVFGVGTDGDTATHALVVLSDRSEAQRAEVQRESLLAELQATLEATADGILVTDLNGRVRAFNRRFAQLWSLPMSMLEQHDDAGVHDWMRRSVVDPDAYGQRLGALDQSSMVTASDRLNLHGGLVLERVTRPLFQSGRPQGRVWSYRDLTERLAAEERIEALSLSDLLTGLLNRRALAAAVVDAAAALQSGEQGFAILVLDLDRFRHINDSLGQATGDKVLQEVARRVQGCLRQLDVLARLGADQFVALIALSEVAAAESAARRILNVVAQPCNLEGTPFTMTCSIGVALAPSHGTSLDDLLRHAESAMRAVKLAGRANFRVYQARAEGDRRLQMKLDHAMRQALVSGRFRLHYQPQVSMTDGRIVGAEALLRWRDPELGEVSPASFIPVAEASGFIIAIGDWVLSQAVRQAVLWHQRGFSMPIAVNVSALQFQQANFVDRVASVLADSGLPPSLLELELTESILVHDADEALARLGALSRLGLQLAIDDFGTGYSSLSYLKRFPIGKLKIDRSFVKGLPGDGSDAGIVMAILQMAQAMKMKVVAEGVETEAQRHFLQSAGCDDFQGFLYAPALDSLSFEQRFQGASSPGPRLLAGAPRMRLVQG